MVKQKQKSQRYLGANKGDNCIVLCESAPFPNKQHHLFIKIRIMEFTLACNSRCDLHLHFNG